MIAIRKIDYYGQLVLATLMLLSIPVLYFYGFLAGLFIMGTWQLLSAALNTTTFIYSVYRRDIRIYWICCSSDLLILLLGWLFGDFFTADAVQAIYTIAIAFAVGIAVYYLVIYNRLIESIFLRNELDGLTKSKH